MPLLNPTRILFGWSASVVAAGMLADAPFYLTYPAWLIARRQLEQTVATNTWPDPPLWMATLHHAFHSIPMLLCGAAIVCAVSGRWPREELLAWGLHILIDIPTHSRRRWGPQFLWPLSDFVLDGMSWTDTAARLIAPLFKAR
jgi:hypothetical protein